MDTHDTPQPDKQITIDVPANRVPEFYAFYARFLAAGEHGGRGRRRGPGGRGRHGHGPHGHGRCGHHGDEAVSQEHEATAPEAPAAG